jgi:4-hydroxy-L-threonine phosphate dehydrogenase PdxA
MDIAGTGRADPSSMGAALELAVMLAARQRTAVGGRRLDGA